MPVFLLRFLLLPRRLQVEDDDADLAVGGQQYASNSSTLHSQHHRRGSSLGSVTHAGRQLPLPPGKLKKRARAWKLFVAVMQEHGLRVRKYHRNGKGWAHRVVTYDPALPGLRWKTSKWWDSAGGQVWCGALFVLSTVSSRCFFFQSFFFFFASFVSLVVDG